MIQVTDLWKAYGASPVLQGLSLRVPEGGLVCLIGRSGCGKSTLLRCLNGLERADRGEVTIGTHHLKADASLAEFTAATRKLRRDVGFVFQQFQLFPHRTLLQNVAIGPEVVLGQTRSQAENEAKSWLKRVGLSGHEDKYPNQLSGGQQQRGAIARALALRPKVMLYDEPTSALDPELVDEVLDVMKKLDLEENITQVVVTHEMRFAKQAADWIIHLDHGKLASEGTPEAVLEKPTNEVTRQFLRRFL